MRLTEYDSFSMCFSLLKIKYVEYDESLSKLNKLSPTDKVNVFINFETVLKFLSTVKDIDKKVYGSNDFKEIMVSNILNLCAHYRRFFRGNGLETRVFLYLTEIDSNEFNESTIYDDYRSYYRCKYLTNPRFASIGEELIDSILPMAKTIANFIPGVYVVSGKNIEGSLIPMIVAKNDETWKNVIISGDILDASYIYEPNFISHIIRRSPLNSSISATMPDVLKNILRKQDTDGISDIYENKSFFILLLAALGEKYRSIEGINGVGYGSVTKLIEQGIENNTITPETTRIELLSKIFPEKYRDDIITNFKCLDINSMYQSLSRTQIYSILTQLEDRVDNNSLLRLNGKDFYKHPLMLEELTM